MADRAVDVVATAPPPLGPYDPGAPAWAIAEGLRARGWSARVLFPAADGAAAPPDGVAAAPVPLALARPGAAVEPAELAKAAGRRLRAEAELVVRDPAGLGVLGAKGRRVVGIVRGLELTSFDAERARRSGPGVISRLDRWRDRRAVRRLERAALWEATELFLDPTADTAATTGEYAVPPGRLRALLPPVAIGAGAPSRESARGSLGFPIDVPVVATLAAVEDPAAAGVDRAIEAFHRMRPLFVGIRMVVAGVGGPSEPGITYASGRDHATFARALAAADIAILPRRTPGFDPGVVLALRAGVPVIALDPVRLPPEGAAAVRVVGGADPGDLSSALAELIADPALRHARVEPGRQFAARFHPEQIAAQLEGPRSAR